MCLAPLTIKNPYYHSKCSSAFLHDTTSQFIYVPCGVCSQCIAVKQMYLVQRVQMESLNSFMFFTTLTYDNSHLPVLTTSTGYDIPFADVSHLQLMFKRLRVNNSFGRPFRYFAVSERGSSDKGSGRPHFHILWFFPRFDGELYCDGLSLNRKFSEIIKDAWCINKGSDKKPIYEPLFEFHQKYYRGKLYSNYDTHFVVPSLSSDGITSLAFYVCKYLLKPNSKEKRLQQAFRLNLPDDEYDYSWNLVKSRSFRSLGFGLGFDGVNRDKVIEYLRNCVKRSDRSLGYPCFFSPETGASFPLAPFYKQTPLIYTYKDMLDFKLQDDSMIFDPEISSQDFFESAKKFECIQTLVDSKDLTINFNFLFD